MPITINGSTGIGGVDGSAGTPAYQGTDTNTGISFGTDVVIASTGGTERARLDSAGRLLVGTSSSSQIGPGITGLMQIEGLSGTTLSVFGNANNTGGGYLTLGKSRGTSVGSNTIVNDSDELGGIYFAGADGVDRAQSAASIIAFVDGTPGANDMPGRLVFSTTADGAATPTERMRITNDGWLKAGTSSTAVATHVIQHPTQVNGNQNLELSNNARFFIGAATYGNAAGTCLNLATSNTTSRSINAGGSINASGADYAEYMIKAGDFTIAKGDVCGVTADGLLTNEFADAVSFVVKSTNPSYVGGDTWGSEDAVGPKPDAEDNEALAQWEADLEAARQLVDRIAFAGQVPVNVTGATPGQYIVPIEAADGGITGIAKDESDLTLAEYMRSVGKVIAIEGDGRPRIIVKVA